MASQKFCHLVFSFSHVVDLDVLYCQATIFKALACVESISMCLAPYVHLLLPPILTILDDTNVKSEVRRASLDTVCQMSGMICLTDHAPRIMQVWLRAISVPVLQQKLLQLLVAVVRQVRFSVLRPVFISAGNQCSNKEVFFQVGSFFRIHIVHPQSTSEHSQEPNFSAHYFFFCT